MIRFLDTKKAVPTQQLLERPLKGLMSWSD